MSALKSAEEATNADLDIGHSLHAHLESLPTACNISLQVHHQQGLVGRLAVVLNAHDVTQFAYAVDREQRLACAQVHVLGGDSQVSRVAHKLRRVVGVLTVTATLADGGAVLIL